MLGESRCPACGSTLRCESSPCGEGFVVGLQCNGCPAYGSGWAMKRWIAEIHAMESLDKSTEESRACEIDGVRYVLTCT